MAWQARAICFAVFLCACGKAVTPVSQSPEAAALPSDAVGWQQSGEASTFDRDNLWDAINGAADLHLDYGFDSLKIQEYQKEDITVRVEIYHQGSPIHAFGLFRQTRPPEAVDISVGSEAATQPPDHCLMASGPYFVIARVEAGELSASKCQGVLAEIAQSLDGEKRLPRALSRLPRKDLVQGSERFTPRSYLGLAELKNCLHAEYAEREGTTYSLFTMLSDDTLTTQQLWSALAETWQTDPGNAAPVLYRQIPYKGQVVVALWEGHIFGVVGKPERQDAAQLIERAFDASGRANDH